MEDLIKQTITILDKKIKNLNKEIKKVQVAKEALQCICKHTFENNKCIYCNYDSKEIDS